MGMDCPLSITSSCFSKPTSGSNPACPYTPIISCLPWWYVGKEKITLSCSVMYKIGVYKLKDEHLRRVSCSDLTAWNLDQDFAWQFLLNLGFSAMIQVVEFARSPAAGKMGLDHTHLHCILKMILQASHLQQQSYQNTFCTFSL